VKPPLVTLSLAVGSYAVLAFIPGIFCASVTRSWYQGDSALFAVARGFFCTIVPFALLSMIILASLASLRLPFMEVPDAILYAAFVIGLMAVSMTTSLNFLYENDYFISIGGKGDVYTSTLYAWLTGVLVGSIFMLIGLHHFGNKDCLTS
jgi:hypothetical protein